jgi:hypothetical protein
MTNELCSHPLQIVLRAGHSSRKATKMKTQSKTGGMTFRITSTQYGWKKIASITQLNPLKFKTWKLQEKTLSRVTSIRI